MARKKTHNCMFCKNRYTTKEKLINHLEKEHIDMIPEKITPSQYYFNYRNGKDGGTCIVCGKPTRWIEEAGRYERLCSDKCREIFIKNMEKARVKKYGVKHLLNDPNHQRKMEQGKKNAGVYLWENGDKTHYLGKYAEHFLITCDHLFGFTGRDVIECPYSFDYEYNGKKCFYNPDYFILPYNTVVEIKDGGSNPNTHPKIMNVDKVKERLKDEAMEKQTKYNYIKITDKNYDVFIDFMMKLKSKNDYMGKDVNFKPLIKLAESDDSIFDNIITRLERDN